MSNQPLQSELWHDTIEDAFRHVVTALGGPKRVGSELWPSKPVTDAARLLNHCLDPERAEKLSIGEIAWLLRAGHEIGAHEAMHKIAEECHYIPPQPVQPEDEQAELQRQFNESVKMQARILKRMEKLAHPGLSSVA